MSNRAPKSRVPVTLHGTCFLFQTPWNCARIKRLILFNENEMKTGILLNGMVLGALALASAAWTFVFLDSTDVVVEQGELIEGTLEFDKKLFFAESSSFVLNGRDSFTVLPGSEVLVVWEEDSKHLDVELFKGSVFFSTLANDMTVSVRSDFFTLDSQNSVALVRLDEELHSASVYALEHASLLRFMKEGKELNALSVPGSYRMGIPSSKVSEVLAKLRLTKLSKEFPIYALSDGDLSSEATVAYNDSKKRYAQQSLSFLKQIQDRSDYGPAQEGAGLALVSTYQSFQEALTVVPLANDRLTQSRKYDALLYAMSHLLYGDAAQGGLWLQTWEAYPHSFDELEVLYSDLFFVLPGDELYPLKEVVANLLYPEQEPIFALRRQLIQIERLLARASQLDALLAYQGYQAQFESALQTGEFDDFEDLDEINREYVLLESILRSHTVFYSVEATHLLRALEDKILALAGSDADLDEERQAFVQSKIRFLDKLFVSVVDRKVGLADATDLATELIFMAESYLNAIQTQVAVQDYFEGQIAEFTVAVQFMNAPEFYSYDSFEEGLEAYKFKLADLEDLNAYIQSIRAGAEASETSLTLEEAKMVAQNDLYSNAIQFKELDSLGDSAFRLFEIVGARTAGYAFTANYDRESRILYDLEVGELRFSTGLTLDSVASVIKEAMAEQNGLSPVDPNSGSGVEDSGTSETRLTEAVALEYVQDFFEKSGLDPADFVFTVVDASQNAFTFEGVLTPLSLPVSGAFDFDTGLVTEIVWEFNSEPYALEDVDLDRLEAAVQEAYESLLSA
jgi:hypothetical protein